MAYRPELPSRLLGAWLPELLEPGAKLVVATAWPTAFVVSGSLALGAGLALVGGRRLPARDGLHGRGQEPGHEQAEDPDRAGGGEAIRRHEVTLRARPTAAHCLRPVVCGSDGRRRSRAAVDCSDD